MSKPTIIFTNEPVDVFGDYDNVYVIHAPSLDDYDTVSDWIRQILDSDLDGPDQMRFALDLAQRFLKAQDEEIELDTFLAGAPS